MNANLKQRVLFEVWLISTKPDIYCSIHRLMNIGPVSRYSRFGALS